MNRRLVLLVAILVGCLVVALGLQMQRVSGHQQMLSLLREVEARTATENAFLGRADLEQLNASLAADAPLPEQMTMLWERSPILQRLGLFDASIADLHRIEEILRGLRSGLPEAEVQDFETELYFNLALAQLRKGEIENCVHCQTGESCILPIQGDGVHVHRSGSQQAIEHLLKVLERQPEHLTARWLLNIAHMTLGSYPAHVPSEYLIPPAAFASEAEFPRLQNIAASVGLDTFGLAGGIVVDDFDGDHLLDVIVSDWDTSAQLRYFRNAGDGQFTERSREAGLEGILGGLNIRHADYDNDGDLDILVLRGGWLDKQTMSPNSLLENDGGGFFRDVTFAVGLGDVHYPTQTADWADFDNDGHLDLYIGNEQAPGQLFRNTGGKRFEDVAASAGVDNAEFAKGVSWGDVNGDGFPDLYISNLGSPNRLFMNNRDGTFTDVAEEKGVAKPIESFPTWFWDMDNDGALDLYVAAYDLESGMEGFVADFLGQPHAAEQDKLFRGDGQGNFLDVSRATRVARVTLPMGSNFGDIDGDGFLDYYLGTGYTGYDALLPNRLFRNNQGQRFDDVSTASGLSHLQKGHGVAIADVNNDGARDVVMVIGGAFPGDGFSNALFRNPGFRNHWITLKLVGSQTNRGAVGAKIRVDVEEDGKQRSIYRWVTSGGSFGGNPLRQEIGIGSADKIAAIEVSWPTSQLTQRFEQVEVDQFLELTEGAVELRKLSVPAFALPDAPPTAGADHAVAHPHDH